MKSNTTLQNLFGSLSQNSSSTNLALGLQLINDQHRYLLQKYFDNERTVQLTTVGSQDLTTTASLSVGAVSATLTGAWAYATGTQLVNFSSGEQRTVLFTQGSTAISWTGALTEEATTALSALGMQAYAIPANISKIVNDTITVGQLKYQPAPVQTRAEWDLITTLPYSSDIPNYYFIYGGQLNIFPIPSTTGNIITFNYKTRVADLSFSDYSTGTISAATAGSTAITGSSTSWSTTATYPTDVDISYYNLQMRINPPFGDGIWYPIRSVTSDTALVLSLPIVNAPGITASSTYTIGQFPILSEDFHDMLVYGALMVYFTSIVKDSDKYKMYKSLYDERLVLLEQYAGTKSVNVDLGEPPAMVNPNLFIYATS